MKKRMMEVMMMLSFENVMVKAALLSTKKRTIKLVECQYDTIYDMSSKDAFLS